jgi:ubiquitin carboxyl-terminal hydrolase L5
VNNACASVALLNIVNNIPNIDLGDNLQQFKDFTAKFSPALRGDAIGNFEFVKEVHNSFARYVLMQPCPVQLYFA